MLSLSAAWHIVWFARVTLSLVLFLVIISRHVYRQFPLFSVYAGWISIAGTLLVGMNYAPFVSGGQYFAGTAISNGVEAALAFAVIYRMFSETVGRHPPLSRLGGPAFRAATLIVIAIAVALAWIIPGRSPSPLMFAHTILERTARILQCGQLVFLFLFSRYFRLSWRSRAFGIALGLGILASTSLAINAIHSQIMSVRWDHTHFALALANDLTYLLAVLVWLFYLLAPEETPHSPPPPPGGLPDYDLETWNRELERML